MKRVKCIKVVVNNGRELTTEGLNYNHHKSKAGGYILDDYGDVLLTREEYFENVEENSSQPKQNWKGLRNLLKRP